MPDYRTQLPWKQTYRHKQVNREAKLGNEFIQNCKLFQAAIKIHNVQYMRMYPSSSRASIMIIVNSVSAWRSSLTSPHITIQITIRGSSCQGKESPQGQSVFSNAKEFPRRGRQTFGFYYKQGNCGRSNNANRPKAGDASTYGWEFIFNLCILRPRIVTVGIYGEIICGADEYYKWD